jgi:hypothetical protein
VVGKPPVYKDGAFPQCIVLHMFITDLFFWFKSDFPYCASHRGYGERRIKYSEVVCENVRKLEACVEEMASGDTVSGSVNIQKVQDDVLNCGPLSRLYLKSVQTRRPALSPYTKASFVLYTILTPVLVLPAAAAHPPSSFDPKLLASLRSFCFLQIKHPYCT